MFSRPHTASLDPHLMRITITFLCSHSPSTPVDVAVAEHRSHADAPAAEGRQRADRARSVGECDQSERGGGQPQRVVLVTGRGAVDVDTVPTAANATEAAAAAIA